MGFVFSYYWDNTIVSCLSFFCEFDISAEVFINPRVIIILLQPVSVQCTTYSTFGATAHISFVKISGTASSPCLECVHEHWCTHLANNLAGDSKLLLASMDFRSLIIRSSSSFHAPPDYLLSEVGGWVQPGIVSFRSSHGEVSCACAILWSWSSLAWSRCPVLGFQGIALYFS